MLKLAALGTRYTNMTYHIYLKELPEKKYLNQVLEYKKKTGYVYWRSSNKIVKSCTTTKGARYKRIMINSEHYVLHRIIYQMHYGDLLSSEVIDHIDRNKQNNKIENLRKANVFINNQNQGERKNNTSGYKGVSWSKQRNKWRATITINKKHKHFGFFATKEEAFICYQKAKATFHSG